jgi:hypothetical protein
MVDKPYGVYIDKDGDWLKLVGEGEQSHGYRSTFLEVVEEGGCYEGTFGLRFENVLVVPEEML